MYTYREKVHKEHKIVYVHVCVGEEVWHFLPTK